MRSVGDSGGVVGRWEKFQKQNINKMKPGGGRGENKVAKKN
jgi:hypothetical protein